MLVIMPVLAVFLAHQSNRIAHQRYLSGTELFRFQAIELLTLFIVIKGAGYLDNTLAEIAAEARGWEQNPGSFFDGETLFAVALTYAGWLAAWSTADDLDELADATRYEGRDYGRPLARLQGKFFLGGLCLLLFTGLTHNQLIETARLTQPDLSTLVFNVLLYFIGGLILLGQLRLTRQERVWVTQKVRLTPALHTRWIQYTLILLSIALGIAFLLPTGYTLSFLDLVRLVIAFLTYLIGLLYFLFILPFTYIFSLLNHSTPPAELPPPLPQPLPQETFPSAGTTGNLWWEVLRSVIFWLIALTALGYVLRSYWKDHPELWAQLQRFRPLTLLVDVFRGVWGWLRQARRDLGEQATRAISRWRAWRAHIPLISNKRRPLGASQREEVFYYYLSTLDQAQAAGAPRRHNQTPYEYRQALTPQLPEAQEAWTELTEAFVTARYSERPVDAENLAGVRDAARQVQAALHTLTDEQNEKTENAK